LYGSGSDAEENRIGMVMYRGGILLFIIAFHLALIGILRPGMLRVGVPAPSTRIVFFNVPPLADIAATASDRRMEPTVSHKRKARKTEAPAVIAGPNAIYDPCAPVSAGESRSPVNARCDSQTQPAPPVGLNIPGGFHQDEQGQIVPNQTGLAPPGSADRQEAEAAKWSLERENAFVPKEPPPFIYGADDGRIVPTDLLGKQRKWNEEFEKGGSLTRYLDTELAR
jgi:hypothetical protein